MFRPILMLIAAVCLAACHGPPVQEMSDARQAIAAARVAGAETRAPADFDAAQAAMTRAEAHIQAHEFARARIAAQEAKRRASSALGSAEHTPAAAPPAAAATPR